MTAIALLDLQRRRLGSAMGAAGLGAIETPWSEFARWSGVRLRRYGRADARHTALLVPAPIKRAYIWDLEPPRSVVRVLLYAGICPFVLEWMDDFEGGLSDAIAILGRSLSAVVATAGSPTILLGHSLGGTLAAITAALHPGAVAGLVLLESPLRFGMDAGALAPFALAALDIPTDAISHLSPIPGTLLDVFSIIADPASFVLLPALDALASLPDLALLTTHLRVRRWLLDEFAMPARLLRDVVIDLYRDDRFYSGTLIACGRRCGPADLTVPILAVVNPLNPDVPPASTIRFLERTPGRSHIVLRYLGERGIALQHVGVLVGRQAHTTLWPPVVLWIEQTAGKWSTGRPRAAHNH